MGAEHSTDHNQSTRLGTLDSPNLTKAYSLPVHDYYAKSSPTLKKQPFSAASVSSVHYHTTSESMPKLIKRQKTIYVQADNKHRVQICFDISEESDLTCGWLVSETIRQFANRQLQESYVNKPIVCLQTLDEIITLDYWLSDPERSISVLRDGIVLKPFYGNTEYSVKNRKVDLRFFHFLKVIGTGGFSKVYLARRKDNGQFFAIKVILKREMLMKDKEENVFNERNIMARMKHPFIVKLHYAFQNAEKLFLVMDFCPGGELFYHLSKRNNNLREDEIKVYMGEIILALNYLHKNNIIYRDLKPENILIDIDGHLQLGDFGLGKFIRNKTDLNYTFCGSPEYMAPEIINRSGYTFNTDFYSLGALIYELATGRAPFSGATNREIFHKALNQEVSYPAHISPNLKMFLSQLLEKDPNERLGAKNGLAEIVNHPWCRDLDFVKIASKKMKAPITPDLYKTNFSRQFLDARVSYIEEDINNEVMNIPADGPIYTNGDGTFRSDNPNLYKRFANFSFYSNLDETYEKFEDSIFVTTNTPDISPRMPTMAGQRSRTLPRDVLGELTKKMVTPRDRGLPTISDRRKYDRSAREDFTEDLNEKSSTNRNLFKFSNLETKFISRPEVDATPKFNKEVTSFAAFDFDFSKVQTGLADNFYKQATKRSSRTPSARTPISYGANQKHFKLLSPQIPAKNMHTSGATPDTLRLPEIENSARNYEDISEGINSKNENPLATINSHRRGGPKIPGINRTQSFSFMVTEEEQQQHEDPVDPKSMTMDLISQDRGIQPMSYVVLREGLLPK